MDDVPAILFLIQQALGRASKDIELVTEVDGSQAIERLRSEKFDLVISDCRMKEKDGVAVLQTAHETNPHGLRVLMTGYNDVPAPMTRVVEMNVDAYIHKSVPVMDIANIVHALLGGDKAAIHEQRANARIVERIAFISASEVCVV
ncbi:MAG: response regulator [Candidatus Thermoplasmatota archaeon]